MNRNFPERCYCGADDCQKCRPHNCSFELDSRNTIPGFVPGTVRITSVYVCRYCGKEKAKSTVTKAYQQK